MKHIKTFDELHREAERMLQADRLAGASPLANPIMPEPGLLSDKGREHLVSMSFRSSKEGEPHIVTETPDGRIQCTCKATLSLETRPVGCWAMVDYRRIKGYPEP